MSFLNNVEGRLTTRRKHYRTVKITPQRRIVVEEIVDVNVRILILETVILFV